MATATFQPYGKFVLHSIKGDIDLDTIAVKAMLMNTAHTPNPSTHEFVSDVKASGAEVTGTNWAAGGVAVTLTLSEDDTTDQVRVEISDISVNTVTLTDGKHVVYYNSTPGTDATNHVIGYGTFDTALAPTAGTLAITCPAPTFWFDYTP